MTGQAPQSQHQDVPPDDAAVAHQPAEDDEGAFHRGFEGRKLGRDYDRDAIHSPHYDESVGARRDVPPPPAADPGAAHAETAEADLDDSDDSEAGDR